MERGLQAIAWALASTGLLIVTFAFADLALTNLPFNVGMVEWRYQVIGRMSQMMITVVFGFTFLLASTALSRSAAGARIVGLLAYLGAIGLVLVTVLFVLERSEASALVPETAQSVFRIGGIRAIVKNVLSAAVLSVIGWAGMVNARSFSRGAASRTKDRDQLITQ